MSDEWHIALIDFGCASSRTLWVKFKFSKVKIDVVVVLYGPTEGKVEERGRFWNDLNRVVDRVGNGYRLCARRSEWMGWIKVENGHNWWVWSSSRKL